MSVVEEHARDIETMRVRGAGAIARHATEALAEWARIAPAGARFEEELAQRVERLRATRPTAVSLRNALDYVERKAAAAPGDPARVVKAGEAFAERSRAAVERISREGAHLIRDGGHYLTHCNSQAALGVFRAAIADGKAVTVTATETRPWRQGHITARQLADMGAATRFVVDSAAHGVLEGVDGVFVGCDTIAANGDVVNKVGTGALARTCRDLGVPLRVCAETYKVDLTAATGRDVPIEERPVDEVALPGELPDAVEVLNPVFDVTSHRLVREVITEAGAAPPGKVADLARAAWR